MGCTAGELVSLLLGLGLLLCPGSAELRAPPDKIGRREGGGAERDSERAPRWAAAARYTQSRRPPGGEGLALRAGRALPGVLGVAFGALGTCLTGRVDMPT